MKKFFSVSLLVAALSFPAFATPYALDAANSKVDFSIKHLKLTKVDGAFKEFGGDIDYENGALKALSGSVNVASVDTQNQKRDDHLRAEDIFDVKKYPQMTFAMTQYEVGKIHGNLTIKGITKPVVFESKETLNGNTLEINAKATIKRSDFGVVWESSLKDSLVGDEVEILLNLKANAK